MSTAAREMRSIGVCPTNAPPFPATPLIPIFTFKLFPMIQLFFSFVLVEAEYFRFAVLFLSPQLPHRYFSHSLFDNECMLLSILLLLMAVPAADVHLMSIDLLILSQVDQTK